jgi:hypothetical protein
MSAQRGELRIPLGVVQLLSYPLVSVLGMKIPPLEQYDYWRQIAAHTSTSSNTAPWPVQLHVAALVGDHGIAGSSVQFFTVGPTTWSLIVVTDDGRLLKVVAEFDAEGYDLEAERNFQDKSPEHRVIEAWVRRLKDVVGFEMRKLEHRRSTFNRAMPDQLDAGDVRLKFVGDEDVDLGIDQLDMPYHEDRQRTDQLITAIRAHIGM